MAYTVNKTDGSIFQVVADGTINNDSSVTLVGKNFAGYGEFLNENFIRLLESSANTLAPDAPLEGQLWFDKSAKLLKVFDGVDFKTISAATASGTQPTNNVIGDIWFDTNQQQLKVWTGSAFITIGPSFTPGTGVTGAIPEVIVDTLSVSHTVVQLFAGDTIVSIVSKDAPFTPATPIPGFTSTIKPGINLPEGTVNGQTMLFQGTATNSKQLDGQDPGDFLSSVSNDTTTGSLGILNNNGLSVGVNNEGGFNVVGTAVNVINRESNGNVVVQVNQGGVPTAAITVVGSTSEVVFNSTITAPALSKSGANGVGNIGSSSNFFDTVFAKATSAQYADLAERFAADVEYPAGTIVELGGTAEVTQSNTELSDQVFGVISTRAAYLMNAAAGDDATHPPVAMTGRVPVRVVGKVKFGDRLVSAGNGVARSAEPGEATPFNTIGRALEDKYTTEESTVEAIVKIV